MMIHRIFLFDALPGASCLTGGAPGAQSATMAPLFHVRRRQVRGEAAANRCISAPAELQDKIVKNVTANGVLAALADSPRADRNGEN